MFSSHFKSGIMLHFSFSQWKHATFSLTHQQNFPLKKFSNSHCSKGTQANQNIPSWKFQNPHQQAIYLSFQAQKSGRLSYWGNKSLEVWRSLLVRKKLGLEKRKLGNRQYLIIDVYQDFIYSISYSHFKKGYWYLGDAEATSQGQVYKQKGEKECDLELFRHLQKNTNNF